MYYVSLCNFDVRKKNKNKKQQEITPYCLKKKNIDIQKKEKNGNDF